MFISSFQIESVIESRARTMARYQREYYEIIKYRAGDVHMLGLYEKILDAKARKAVNLAKLKAKVWSTTTTARLYNDAYSSGVILGNE